VLLPSARNGAEKRKECHGRADQNLSVDGIFKEDGRVLESGAQTCFIGNEHDHEIRRRRKLFPVLSVPELPDPGSHGFGVFHQVHLAFFFFHLHRKSGRVRFLIDGKQAFRYLSTLFINQEEQRREGKMGKRLCLIGGFLLLFSVASASAADEVVVGSVTPLSGKLAVYGEGFQQAMLLALEEVNDAGGINGKPMRILYEDNNSTAKDSVSAMQKLITVHKLPLIFGPAASSNFLAVCPVAQENKTILIGAQSAASEITKCGEYVFRVFPSDELQGKGAAELAASLGCKEVVLTYVNNDWGVGLGKVFKDNFLKAGGKIIDEFSHDEGKTDYRSEVLRVKKHSPNAAVNLTYIKEGATMLKQAYELGLKVQWLMGSASKSPKLVELAGEAAEGIIGTYPTFSQDTPQYLHFKQAWERKHPDKKIPIFGEYNYDMVHLTARALKTAKSMSSADIRNALIEASIGYVGVTGDKTFDENGDVGAVYGIWTVKEGEIGDYRP
jgi:branched-chain amino acid transport system substrate-binding protein